MTTAPRVLIEDWLPVAELGIESRRERAVSTTIPPLNRLHVWWARRPLVAAAAVVLGGLLPAWSPELREAFDGAKELQSEQEYRSWLLRLVGIWGDPVLAKKQAEAAKSSGRKSTENPYSYKQAYKNSVGSADVELLHAVLRWTWGDGDLPLVADPTAGGGSIPFTATRLGIPTHANDLNAVAASVLYAGVKVPAERGTALTPVLREWGKTLVSRVEKRLLPFFPQGEGEEITNYIFANAVACPRTGRLVPLMTDKWLRRDAGKEVAIELVTEVDGLPLQEPVYRLLTGAEVDRNAANAGTVGRGVAVSPYDDLVISGEYIKAEAQAGRMRQVLYAVATRNSRGDRVFRAPNSQDVEALRAAETELDARMPDWVRRDIVPTEDIPDIANYERGHRMYGMYTWLDMFTPRQALVHATFADEYVQIIPEIREALGDLADPVLVELALLQGKALNWNAKASTWNVPREHTRSVFDKHNFSFKWTFSEMEGARSLYQWTTHVFDNYDEIAREIETTGASGTTLDAIGAAAISREVVVSQGSAANVGSLADGSVTHLCMDPPYYDNVMYAELSDFFYVWEKRTLGRVLPQYFTASLTDKDNEAIANPARFEAMGRRKAELATLDYEAKMTAIFSECRRVLRDGGVLSVMFTHKRAEAWDTLGMGLLQAGFTIETSWPVNTEAENSLHQANVNSAASTIMLVCRKRPSNAGGGTVFLDDIEAEIRQAARDAATRFQEDGIEGVDLLLSTYGPTLSVISSHWPVYSSTPDESGRDRLLRPEEALDLAREEVVRLRRQRIVGKAAQIDGYTDFVLLAWDIFSAREFPFDTARLLALAVGGHDVDDLERAKIIEKKSGTVRLLTPKERLRRDADSALPGVRPEAKSFDSMIDAVDTVLYIGDVDGMAAAKVFMDKVGLTTDSRFHSTVQGLVNTIPRARVKGDWVMPEAGLLNTLVTAYLGDYVTLPADEPESDVTEQGSLFDSAE